MITEQKMEQALDYLASTDNKAAQAKANVERLSKTEKTILGVVFLEASGNNAEREYKARTSENYRQWQKEHEDAVLEFEIIRNKRNRAELTIEVWRSLNANQRRGNL